MRFFKSDGDGIFTGARAQALYDKYHIRHLQSAPGDSASNDVAERTIRTFAELATTNLLHANAPASFWGEAMGMIEYVWNRIPVLEHPSGIFISRTAYLEGHTRFALSGQSATNLLTLQKGRTQDGAA